MTDIVRVALCGAPGVGKSTVRRLTQVLAGDLGLDVHHLRLADPLYAAQKEVYKLSGRPLVDDELQDGRLLNMLGVEMRRINPEVLADHARAYMLRISGMLEGGLGRHVVLCDDMRPPDAAFMRDLGFEFVEVRTPPAFAARRRRLRGDVTLGSENDPNEVGIQAIEVIAHLDNDGDMDQLTTAVAKFWTRRLR